MVAEIQTTVAQLNEMNKHLVSLITGQMEELASLRGELKEIKSIAPRKPSYADVSKANGKARALLVGNRLLRHYSSDEFTTTPSR